MRALEDGAIDAPVAEVPRSPSSLSVAIVEHCHGAVARVPPSATAFAPRESPLHFEVIAFWEDPAETDANVGLGARGLRRDPALLIGRGPRQLARRRRERSRARGLAALKRRYDHTNVFRVNQNIPPAPPLHPLPSGERAG